MPISLTLESVIARSPDVIVAGLDKGLAMMRLESNAYYTLDDIGTAIWQLVEQPMTVGAVCAALEQRYAVSAEQCQVDVLAFLNRACAEGIMRLVPPGAG